MKSGVRFLCCLLTIYTIIEIIILESNATIVIMLIDHVARVVLLLYSAVFNAKAGLQ